MLHVQTRFEFVFSTPQPVEVLGVYRLKRLPAPILVGVALGVTLSWFVTRSCADRARDVSRRMRFPGLRRRVPPARASTSACDLVPSARTFQLVCCLLQVLGRLERDRRTNSVADTLNCPCWTKAFETQRRPQARSELHDGLVVALRA